MPVVAAIEDTFTMSPSPLAFSIGWKARMVAKTPRQLDAKIESINSSVSASRLAIGTGCVKPAVLTSM